MKNQTRYGQRSEAIMHGWLNSRPSTIQPISSASTRMYRLCADPPSGFCRAVPMYPRGRQIEGPARTALSRSREGSRAVSRLRHLAAVSKLDPGFAEKFLAFVIREVIRHHESARRATTEGIFRD